MDTPPTLATLPSELIVKVFQDEALDRDDLASLRLTGKSIHALVTEELAKRYFTSLIGMISRYSLQALVDICEHPVFGPFGREIRLSPNRVHPDNLCRLVDNFEQYLETEYPPEDADNASHELQAYAKIRSEQRNLSINNSEEPARLLTLAFEALKKRGNPVGIAVHYARVDWINSFGERTISCAIGETKAGMNNFSWELDNHLKTALQLLVVGAFRSGCKISSLKMPTQVDEENLEAPENATVENQTYFDILDVKTEAAFAVSGLKHLEIKIAFRPGASVIRSLELVFSVASQLEFLHYEVDECHHDCRSEYVDSHDRVINSVASTSVKRLEIVEIPMSQRSLLRLLDRVRDPLRALEMMGCGVRDGSCNSTIGWIRKNLCLDYLECGLNNLVFDGTKYQPVRWEPAEWLYCPDRASVLSTLAELSLDETP